MDLTAWALYALIVAAALAGAVFHYRRHEPAGRGRVILGVLRGTTLAVLLLLLFDPVVPAVAVGGAGGTAVLVDASLSMGLPAERGGTAWGEARSVVDSVGADRVLLCGAGEALGVAGLGEEAPVATGSRLAPALRSALEAGAERVLVVTDGALEDAAEAERIAGAGAGHVRVRLVGDGGAANLGLPAVEAPAWLEVGERATVRVTVDGRGPVTADSVTVVVSRDSVELGRATAAAPARGQAVPVSVPIEPGEAGAGPVRLDIALTPGGAVAADDVRHVYVRIAEEPAGVALVSFQPDQEPRFLLPVLERALGLPVRGWMALAGDRYLRLGTGEEAGRSGDVAGVRRAVAGADLVVLHGLTAAAPEWAQEAAAVRRRVLVFPGDPWPRTLPVGAGPARAGDWYPVSEPPPSPVAALLAGVEAGDAPPLTTLRAPTATDAELWTPVEARLGRQGEPRPVVLAGEPDGRRVAVALGTGYWRWAFAGGGGRELYDRMWSAVAAWLLEAGPDAGPEAVRPATLAVPRGAEIQWLAPGDADSLRISYEPLDGSAGPARDTSIAAEAGRGSTAALPPGRYRYRAGVPGDSGVSGEGELTVEAYSPELSRPTVPLRLDGGGGGDRGAGAMGAPGRPLHATPWPYAVVVLLLCVEWVLRRRWGLR